MKGKELIRGGSGNPGMIEGLIRVVDGDLEKKQKMQKGEIYVADRPTPDDDPYLRKAAALITNRGGRTSHAAFVGAQWGIPVVVGTLTATNVLYDGLKVVVDCNQRDDSGRPIGIVYEYVGEDYTPPPAPPPKPGLSMADKMAKIAAMKDIGLPEGFLDRMRKRE